MKTKIISVIHYEDDEQAMRNAARAVEAGCEGVMLIDMTGGNTRLPAIARAIKKTWPDLLVGLNLLGAEPADAVATSIANGLDMTWTDEQITHSAGAPWLDARAVAETMDRKAGHLAFIGVAFKHQPVEPDPVTAARLAIALNFIPTTSGAATGVAADASAVAALRAMLGTTAPLAIASGVTPENAHEFAPHLSHILVSTGVSASFHEFDPERLRALRKACDDIV